MFGLGVVGYFLDVLEQVVDVLGLGKFLEDAFLVGLEDLFLVLHHLPVLVVVVAENVVDLLHSQGPVHPFDVLQLACDEIVFVQDLVHEVVRRHVLPVDYHVIYQVEL